MSAIGELMEYNLSWMRRHWKLFVGFFAVVMVLGVAVFVPFVLHLLKDSQPYRDAMQRVRNDARMKAILGEPIEEGLFPTGEIETSSTSGHASLEISLSGPKGSGTLDLAAHQNMGDWQFDQLVFMSADHSQTVDLTHSAVNATSQ